MANVFLLVANIFLHVSCIFILVGVHFHHEVSTFVVRVFLHIICVFQCMCFLYCWCVLWYWCVFGYQCVFGYRYVFSCWYVFGCHCLFLGAQAQRVTPAKAEEGARLVHVDHVDLLTSGTGLIEPRRVVYDFRLEAGILVLVELYKETGILGENNSGLVSRVS
ncbi:hypothetical protein B0T25DRAFT_526392 [Lasiosphaeria hispida]|uniref:Uncharacterized protein n=1 Tax=Lasiosphaeria hispida TaxID=260671 RepID=A0AAJ0HUX2_9PEZI|nr:hypothetical protein B0T25DRAFT_526392 [Lasiosphaeria hispida]